MPNSKDTTTPQVLDTEKLVRDILSSVERDREREIVARRYGLFERKETLEQIGELLGITRERVRQLEKSLMSRFKTASEAGQLPAVAQAQQMLTQYLESSGSVARIGDISASVTAENSRTDQSRVAFLASLCPKLVLIEEDDLHTAAAGVANSQTPADIKKLVAKLVDVIAKQGEPVSIEQAAQAASIDSTAKAAALASVSKKLATLNDKWGLAKWPAVNPKNIRDKIHVILQQNGRHMHFNEIADAIKKSEFKRKDVTTQAIHNELIKDGRFVLIGRGIYALKEWGYKKGTVADIISEVLREAGEPLHRDEIVQRVLKTRFVKETTILLNLQGKPQFKRVAKATYALDE